MSYIRKHNGIEINPPHTIGGTSITSTTSETILDSVLVPANTFKLYDVFGVEARTRKIGTAGGYTVRIRINTSNSITGSYLIAQGAPFLAAIPGYDITRRFSIKNLTSNTEVMASGSTNVSSDIAQPTNNYDNHAIDWTTDQYIIVTAQLNNSSDTARLRHLYLDCPEATLAPY